MAKKIINVPIENELLTKIEDYCKYTSIAKSTLLKIAADDFLRVRIQKDKKTKEPIF